MTNDLFVTGTDTGVGKTLLSALLVAALGRKYWKPIQTGGRDETDRQTVMNWAGVAAERTHPEVFIFQEPVSPHLAAEQEHRQIRLGMIRRPSDPEPVVIEGAGGVLVPINNHEFMLDLMQNLRVPVVVAARTILGTINHTLLTVFAIRGARLELRGVVMVGPENADNRRAIERYGDVPVIGSIPRLDVIHPSNLCRVFEERFDKSAFS
ncbi:MAG: dethiobiotin synthase [Acidobacteria bacterium]|nr:MAG: dethiobiotin synthase [Acidobacteriota bacterium]